MGGRRSTGPRAAMVREVTWFVQGHTPEVKWMPGPGTPKPEVFRGHGKLYPKRREEIRSPPLPPNTGLARSGASRVENPILPSVLPAEQLAGGPCRSSCLGAARASAPLGTWGRRPHHSSWSSGCGVPCPQPLAGLQAGDSRGSGPDPPFLCLDTKRTTPAFLPSGNPTGEEGAVWACFPVCVLACSCFCHF